MNKEKNIENKEKKSLIKMNTKNKEKNNNKLKKIEYFLNKNVMLLIAILVLAIGISAIFITAYFPSTLENAIEKTDYRNDNIIINIVLVCAGLTIIYFLQKILDKIKIKYVLAGFSVLFIILSTLFCVYIKIGPIADQGFMITGAQAVLARAMSSFIEPGGYLDMFPYQFGYVIYAAVILKILGKLTFLTNLINIDAFIYFQILNSIYNAINMILLYLIAKRIFKNDKNVLKILTVLLIGFSLYLFFFNTHIYGNIPGLMFSLIAVYFTIAYLQDRKIYDIIIVGISISGAIIFKTNFNIFLCGIIIILLMDFLKRVELKKIGMILIILCIFVFSKWGLNKVIGRIIQMPTPTGVPMISYVYMGFAPSNSLSSGWYTADVIEIYNRSGHDTDEAVKETNRLITERLNHFKNDLKEANRYFWDKVKSTWLNPTFQTIWIITPGTRYTDPNYAEYLSERPVIKEMVGYTENLYKIEEQYFDTYQIIIFVFAGIALIGLRKEDNVEILLLPVIFLGGLLFHILWETKSIYVILYYFILLPFAAKGIDMFFKYIKEKDFLNKIILKIKENKENKTK